MVEKIYNAANHLKVSMQEEIFITGYVASHILKYNLYEDKNFLSSRPFYLSQCFTKQYVAINEMPPDDILYLWNDLKNPQDCNLFE